MLQGDHLVVFCFCFFKLWSLDHLAKRVVRGAEAGGYKHIKKGLRIIQRLVELLCVLPEHVYRLFMSLVAAPAERFRIGYAASRGKDPSDETLVVVSCRRTVRPRKQGG